MESEFCQVDLHENSVIIEVMLVFIISKIEAAIELSSQDMLESGQFYINFIVVVRIYFIH